MISRIVATSLGASLLVAISLLLTPESKATQCTITEEIAAEGIVGNLKTWSDVYKAYVRFEHCDDGSIGEGFSESITNLLANHWSRLGELSRHRGSHPQFLEFILKHINMTVPEDRLKTIEENALMRCNNFDKLCKEIAIRARIR